MTIAINLQLFLYIFNLFNDLCIRDCNRCLANIVYFYSQNSNIYPIHHAEEALKNVNFYCPTKKKVFNYHFYCEMNDIQTIMMQWFQDFP